MFTNPRETSPKKSDCHREKLSMMRARPTRGVSRKVHSLRCLPNPLYTNRKRAQVLADVQRNERTSTTRYATSLKMQVHSLYEIAHGVSKGKRKKERTLKVRRVLFQ